MLNIEFKWSLTERLNVVEFTYSAWPLHMQEGVHGWHQVSMHKRIAYLGLHASVGFSPLAPCCQCSNFLSCQLSVDAVLTLPRERGVGLGSGLSGPDHGRALTIVFVLQMKKPC